MSLDSRPLPRRLPNPAYLDRLRQRAVIRMRQDELDATQVTRRWSLQRVGLALAAAGLMRSAYAAGRRTPAPQYGVPGLPGNPSAPTPTSFATRDDLPSLRAWNDSYVSLVGGEKKFSVWGGGGKAKTTYYRLASGQLVIVSFLTVSGTTFFVPGGKAFYVFFGTDLFGATLTNKELDLTPSLYRTPTPPGGDAEAIQRFAAEMNDTALAAAGKRQIRIAIAGKTVERYPYITDLTLDGNILQIAAMSQGILYVDLKAQKVVDGGTGTR